MMSSLLLAVDHAHEHGWDRPDWWPIFPLLWVAVIVLVVVLLRRRAWSGNSGMSVLAERFARGEITEDEYNTRRAVLRGKRR